LFHGILCKMWGMDIIMRRFGDRYDGRLIRSLDAFYKIIPFIMKTRVDALVYFDDKIELDYTEAYIRIQKADFNNNIRFLHIVIAAMVRTISQKPGLNRFIAGQRIFARNEILISLCVKKELKEDSPETVVKMKFKPTDTILDIVGKVNTAIEENKKIETSNDADKTAKLFMLCPRLIINFLISMVKFCDYYGIMPKVINRISPFHTSIFITDLGSLGIKPVYHHLYNFGTTSAFISFGKKEKEKIINQENVIIDKRYIDLKIVVDERIADGYYFANAFKLFKKLIQNPERLELPPENVFEDIE